MISSPEARQALSTTVLEHELVMTENVLRDALAYATKVNGSSDDVYIRNSITCLKTKANNYEVANHALVTRKEQTGHVQNTEHLVEIRLGIVHQDVTNDRYSSLCSTILLFSFLFSLQY